MNDDKMIFSPKINIYYKLDDVIEIQRCFINRDQYLEFERHLEQHIKNILQNSDCCNYVRDIILNSDGVLHVSIILNGAWTLDSLKVDHFSHINYEEIRRVLNNHCLVVPNGKVLYIDNVFYVKYGTHQHSKDHYLTDFSFMKEYTIDELEKLYE